MPKRSNEFQKLVYLVRVNLAEGARVTESKMLLDRSTGRKREVDVCIEGAVGGHSVTVCIECRDHARRADVTWVERMKCKHERLTTNALILASRSGFTREAQKVANGYGISALSLQEIDETDFPALLDTKSTLWTKSVSLGPRKVIVRVLSTPTLPAEDVPVLPDNLLYASDGAELGPIGEFVHLLLQSPSVGRDLLSKAKQEHSWFEFRWEPPRGHLGGPFFLKQLEPKMLREIQYIEAKGRCEFRFCEFGLRRGVLGGIWLAWGQTEIVGQDAILVATRDTKGLEKMSLHIVGQPPQVEAPHPNERSQGTRRKRRVPEPRR